MGVRLDDIPRRGIFLEKGIGKENGMCIRGSRNSGGEANEWEMRLERRGAPKQGANLRRLAFYLKAMGSPPRF